MHTLITHTTRFAYTGPVFLEPHTVRLRPRCDCTQRLIAFSLDVTPPPTGRTENVEPDGNTVTTLWFDGERDACTITASAEIETLRSNPFDYLLHAQAERLPYRGVNPSFLSPYCDGYPPDPQTRTLALDILGSVNGRTIPFIQALMTHIAGAVITVVRPTGDPLPAHETLAQGEGACRDLTALFMSACSVAGLATRFVSGYHIEPRPEEDWTLHAWAEVYLPGAGWRGYDPSHGLAVADQHVAVAAGPTHNETRPVEGSYRGTGVQSQMTTSVFIEPIHKKDEG